MSGNSVSPQRSGVIVGLIAWLVVGALSMSGLLVDQPWALAVGVAFGLIGIPYAIWVATPRTVSRPNRQPAKRAAPKPATPKRAAPKLAKTTKSPKAGTRRSPSKKSRGKPTGDPGLEVLGKTGVGNSAVRGTPSDADAEAAIEQLTSARGSLNAEALLPALARLRDMRQVQGDTDAAENLANSAQPEPHPGEGDAMDPDGRSHT